MTKLRKTALAFGTACAIAFTGGLALNAIPANADTKAAGDRGYYGTKLANQGTGYALATAFYDELVQMAEDPDGDGPELSTLRKGEAHLVTDTSIVAEATNYAGGSMTLIKQFGAALDCFRYDYADLFYVNFDRLTVSVAEVKSEEPPEESGTTEESDAIPVPHDGEGGGEGGGETIEYKVTIGAGRATSYLLFDADDLNGKKEEPESPPEEGGTETLAEDGETATLYTNYIAKYDELIEKVNNELQPSGSGEGEETALINYDDFTVEKKVSAVNKVLGENFTYGFGNDYVNTTYFITETGSKPNASSEGFARLFKTIMHTVGVDDCLIVSGYYVTNGAAKACTWNYVKDGGKWYGVDVANNLTSSNKYLLATGDLFFADHYENKVVSLSNYQLKYPEIAEFAFKNYNVVTGELQVAHGTLGSRTGIVVADYAGEGTLSIRVKDGDGNWGAWIALSDYESANRYNIPVSGEEPPEESGTTEESDAIPVPHDGEEGGEGEGGGETTTIDETNCKVAYDETKGLYYLFDLKNGDYEIAIVKNGTDVVEKNETVADSIDSKVVSIPLVENDLRLKPQPIGNTPFEIKFGTDVKISEGEEIIVEYTVGSLKDEELAFVKNSCKLGTATLGADKRTLTFDFTPCGSTQYSGLCYTFTFPNLVEDAEDGTAVPGSYPVVFKYEGDSLRMSGVSVGSNLYTDIVTQPSLVFNNDLSLKGWTYDGKELENDNMIGALALSVGKMAATEEIESAIGSAVAANTAVFKEGAFTASTAPSTGDGEGEGGGETPPATANTVEVYSLNLTLDGKATAPKAGSYLKLSFPYPAGHGPEDKDTVVYKVFQCKRDANGNIDYTSGTMLDVVAARQGLVVAVNDPSAVFAIVAFDADKINETSKVVLTETSGVGGSVSGTPVNKVSESGSHSYTIKAEDGYVLDSIIVNGVAQELPEGSNGTYTFTLNGSALGDTTYNALRVEFRPAGENVSADDYAVANGASAAFAEVQVARGEYSNDEKASIVTDYPGGSIFQPKPPIVFNTASTFMQKIIVLSVVGGIALIGVIAIIYCGAIRPKILREREEEAARIAAQRERRANRNRAGYDSRRR